LFFVFAEDRRRVDEAIGEGAEGRGFIGGREVVGDACGVGGGCGG
jgi:hypothetical protein